MFSESKEDDLTRARLRHLMQSGPGSTSGNLLEKKKETKDEEILRGSKYKPRIPPNASNPMERMFDDSIERAMYDEMVGSVLKSRPVSSSSSSGSKSSGANVSDNFNNLLYKS